MDFQQKIIERSGLGDETGLSDGESLVLGVKYLVRAVLQGVKLAVYEANYLQAFWPWNMGH